jgi:hypothetical protein
VVVDYADRALFGEYSKRFHRDRVGGIAIDGV